MLVEGGNAEEGGEEDGATREQETEIGALRAKIDELNSAIDTACDEEDYDAADALETELKAVVAALNEFNHSVQRFKNISDYEAARLNYLEDIVEREAMVEDAITGNMLRIKDQVPPAHRSNTRPHDRSGSLAPAPCLL